MLATLPKQDAASYYADTNSLSNSMLNVFRNSATLFEGRFVTNTIPEPEPTPAMKLGTWLHMALLETDRWSDCIAKQPVGIDRRTKAGKEQWESFCDSNKGREIVPADDHELVERMFNAVRKNETCRSLLDASGLVEEAIYFAKDSRRCKLDKLVHDSHQLPVCILDVKSCNDPSPAAFQRSMANLRYHCQAAWYQDAVRERVGCTLPFYFLAVGTSQPHDVAMYECSEESLQIGREANTRTVEQIEACRESGVWLNDWNKDIRTITLPRWAQQGVYEGA